MKKEHEDFLKHMENTMDKELDRYFDNPERPVTTITIRLDGRSVTLEYLPDLHCALSGALENEFKALGESDD